jgi:hypothetical protein
MSRIIQLSRFVVGSKLARRAVMQQVVATDARPVYVGLGDQFDDDRRLVHDVAKKRGLQG